MAEKWSLPKPLNLSGTTKTKGQHRFTRRKKAKGGNSKDTAQTNKKRPCRGDRKTRLRRELKKLATPGSVERTKLLHVDKTVYNISEPALATNVSAQERTGVRSGSPLPQSCSTWGGPTGIYLRLRLQDYFADAPQAELLETSALGQTDLWRNSWYMWQPARGSVSTEVGTFISVFHESVKKAFAMQPTPDAQNLSKEERFALKQLQNRTAIVIRPTDKRSAVVVQNTTADKDKVARQLSDDNFYNKLDRDPTVQNNAKIRQAVCSLKERGVINIKTAIDLVETKIKALHFYTLSRIHKSTSNPPGRTIVSSVRPQTERISAFVDLLLKPLFKDLPSYVRDTLDFLTALQAVPPLPDHALLFTMDVVVLYNNIPHVDGLEACRAFLNGRRVQDPLTEDIVKLAELVLTLNAFQFEHKYFLQIKGTAMRTRMAPSYANLFMGKLENKILDQAPDSKYPSFYRRLIDDVFGILLYGEDSLLKFFEHANNCHPDIRFTYAFGKSVPYLDASISIGSQHISTDLSTMPTDTHKYLLTSSDHPTHVDRNLSYGLVILLYRQWPTRTGRMVCGDNNVFPKPRISNTQWFSEAPFAHKGRWRNFRVFDGESKMRKRENGGKKKNFFRKLSVALGSTLSVSRAHSRHSVLVLIFY